MGDYRNAPGAAGVATDDYIRVGGRRERTVHDAAADRQYRATDDYPDQPPRPARDMPEFLARHGKAYTGPAPAEYRGEDIPVSTVDQIVGLIREATDTARQTGHKLHDHANALFGAIPMDEEFCGLGNAKVPAELPAIERLYRALAELDRAQSYMAQGAARNCTLA